MFLPDVHVNCQMFFFRVNGNSKSSRLSKPKFSKGKNNLKLEFRKYCKGGGGGGGNQKNHLNL